MTLTRLLNLPDYPPFEWTEKPDSFEGLEPGTIRIVTSGPDEGRVYGLIQPPPELAVFSSINPNHHNNGLRPFDATLYPDEMRSFNRGPIEVQMPDGTIDTIKGGVLSLGGHSSQNGARNAHEAQQFLNREGRWTERAGELLMHGRAYPITEGPMRGGVGFFGAALPGMTAREAAIINGTEVSAECHPHHAYGGQPVFLGAVVVDHTAWKMNNGMVAASAETVDNGAIIITTTTAAPLVEAEADDDAFNGLRDTVSELAARLDELETLANRMSHQIGEHAIELAAEGLSDDEKIASLEQQISSLREELEALAKKANSAGQPTQESEGPLNGPSSITQGDRL